MSSISSIGQSITPYLQGLGLTPQAAPSDPASATTAAQGADGDSSGSTQAVSGRHHHHHGGGGGESGGLFKQIQSAVSSALQTAQANGSNTDPNQVVQDAIAQVLKNHQNGQSASTTQPSAAQAGGTDSSTAKTTFDQLLQANGVDPQQFQQDFLSAIQSAQAGGSTDAGAALASFPPGSAVDTLA